MAKREPVNVPCLLPVLNQIVDTYAQDHKQHHFCAARAPITNVYLANADTSYIETPYPSERIPFPDGRNNRVVVIERDPLSPPITHIYLCDPFVSTKKDYRASPITDIQFINLNEYLDGVCMSNYALIRFGFAIGCLYKTTEPGIHVRGRYDYLPRSIYMDPATKVEFPFNGANMPSLGQSWKAHDIPLTGFEVVKDLMAHPCRNRKCCIKIDQHVHVHGIFGEGSPIVYAELSPTLAGGGDAGLDWMQVTDTLSLKFAHNWSILWRHGKQACPQLVSA